MEEIIKLDEVDKYNKFFGLETRHPLVSVVDLSKATRWPEHFRINYWVYALFLKNVKCGDIRYGRQIYDYQEGTVVCMAPGQVSGIDNRNRTAPRTKSIGVLFHPDLIRGTSLGQNIKNYTFFSYEVNEALHLSDQEREIVTDCIHKIRIELEHPIDKHSKQLIVRNIELLLDYCMRFYERQFITRNQANKDIIVKFEQLLDEYFQNQVAITEGLPSVKYFADKACLSPNYFGVLQYGLKARPRRPAAFNPPEIGTFFHYVLQHTAQDATVAGGFAVVTDEELGRFTDHWTQRYIHDELNDFQEKSARGLKA